MSKAYLKLLTFPILLFPLFCSNCAPHLQLTEEGRYSDPQGNFQLTVSRDGWQLLSWEDVHFVLWDPEEGATIVVNVTSLKEEVDLATLTRHLLIAFERKQIISQETTKVDGREAVKTVVEGWVEKTAVKAETYVVRGEGVFYDIIFWAPRDTFPRKIETFRQFLGGIKFLQPKGPQ